MECMVKYAVIPANVGMVWMSIIAIRDAFLPVNLYLEYAYPVKLTTIKVNMAVAPAINKVFFTHCRYRVSVNRYSKCLVENSKFVFAIILDCCLPLKADMTI